MTIAQAYAALIAELPVIRMACEVIVYSLLMSWALGMTIAVIHVYRSETRRHHRKEQEDI